MITPFTFDSLRELPLVLFGAMSDGVLVTDRNGVLVDCNPAFHRQLGYEKSEVIGRSMVSLDDPEFASKVPERLAQITRQGQSTFETAHRKKDGSIVPVEISAHLCKINGEEAFFGIVRDLRERKAAERELRRRQECLIQAEALAQIGSWELDLVENRLTWSDEIFRIFEIDPTRFEASYESFLDAIHPEDRYRVDGTYRKSVDSGKPYEITHRLRLEDGRIKWVKEQGKTFYDQDKPIRSVGTIQDITKHKLAEDALRNSEAHLRTLIQTLPDLVWLKDPHGVYLGCNRKFERFFGAKEAEIIGKTDHDFVDKELADFFREKDRLAMEVGAPSINEEEITYADDGHREKLEVIKTPMYDANGKLIGVLGVGRDITERKRFEAVIRESLETYQTAINTPALGFLAVDAEGRLRDVNEAYAKQSGYSREELLQMGIPDLEAKESPEETKAHMAQIVATGYARFRTEHRRKDETVWPVEVVITFSLIQGGRFFSFLEDITDKIEQERRLELATRVFDTMNQAVIVTNADNEIISLNPAATEITGYSLEEVRGRKPSILSSGRHDRSFYAQMWASLNAKGYWEGEIWDRRKDGDVYPKWLTINAIQDSHGKLDQYVSVFSDITERKKTEEIIWKQANYDSLTGLANRILFQTRLQQELDHCSRNGGLLGVVYLDLDGFKHVNDSLGHAGGDKLLVEVAKRLQHRARKSDLVARLGGDEFVFMITDFRHPEQIGSLAEGILEVLKAPVKIEEKEVRIGASIGIALYPDDGASREELTKNADVAMYKAKEGGKNNFQFFRPEMNSKAIDRLSLIHDLHKAVDDKAFQLHYQPKVRLRDQKVIGMEALIRWPTVDGRMVSPTEFIPCAEETGLIVPIGGWALSEACRQTHRWNRRFGSGLKVAVNLSARQFRTKNLVVEVQTTLEVQSLPAHLLEIEITESILMEDVDEAIRIMEQLRHLGISIAIDDFGTGYSSLSYLKRFPVSTLKIDQSFVHDLTKESEDAAIVGSTITLAKNLGLELVAEGVETAEQLKFLQDRQCPSAQGYYFAKPMPVDEFEAFLDSRRADLI